MTAQILGTLEIVASADLEDRRRGQLLEMEAIDIVDRRMAAGIGLRITEYPAIALELVGGMAALRGASDGLAFIDERYAVTSHSGPMDFSDIGPLATDVPASSRMLVQFEAIDSDDVIEITLEDMVIRQGSTVRTASLRAAGQSTPDPRSGFLRPVVVIGGAVGAAVISTLVSITANFPEIQVALDGLYVQERAAIVEKASHASGSPCAATISYVPDVETMRAGIADTYDFEDAADPEERRRRICNLQIALKVIGRDAVGEIDGVYGPKTRVAWSAFRKSNDLEGPVDNIDYEKLSEAFRARLEARLFRH